MEKYIQQWVGWRHCQIWFHIFKFYPSPNSLSFNSDEANRKLTPFLFFSPQTEFNADQKSLSWYMSWGILAWKSLRKNKCGTPACVSSVTFLPLTTMFSKYEIFIRNNEMRRKWGQIGLFHLKFQDHVQVSDSTSITKVSVFSVHLFCFSFSLVSHTF